MWTQKTKKNFSDVGIRGQIAIEDGILFNTDPWEKFKADVKIIKIKKKSDERNIS